MKGKNNEKKIYECLGVNIFRKYVLGAYQALWNGLFFITGITKFFGIKDIYKMSDFSSDRLKSYKKFSKIYAIEHVCSIILMSTTLVLGGAALSTFLTWWIPFVMITDVYAIMTQRYHHIRINEILEKREELQKRHEERQQNENNSQDEEKQDLIQPQIIMQQLADDKTPQEIVQFLKTTKDELLSCKDDQNNSLNTSQPNITQFPTFDDPNDFMAASAIMCPAVEKGTYLGKRRF